LIVLLGFLGLNAADALLTALTFSLGALEVNSFLGAIAVSGGEEQMLLVKLLFTVALGGVLWQRGAFRILRGLSWGFVSIVR